ncbi:hypothetical protein BOX15_Mlig011412g2, partial [Macrostomum lignano]
NSPMQSDASREDLFRALFRAKSLLVECDQLHRAYARQCRLVSSLEAELARARESADRCSALKAALSLTEANLQRTRHELAEARLELSQLKQPQRRASKRISSRATDPGVSAVQPKRPRRVDLDATSSSDEDNDEDKPQPQAEESTRPKSSNPHSEAQIHVQEPLCSSNQSVVIVSDETAKTAANRKLSIEQCLSSVNQRPRRTLQMYDKDCSRRNKHQRYRQSLSASCGADFSKSKTSQSPKTGVIRRRHSHRVDLDATSSEEEGNGSGAAKSKRRRPLEPPLPIKSFAYNTRSNAKLSSGIIEISAECRDEASSDVTIVLQDEDANGTATDKPIVVQNADGTATDEPIVQNADGTATDKRIVQDAEGTATDESIVQDADGTATDEPIVQDADGTATDEPIVQDADGNATDEPIVQDADGTATDEPIVQDADGTATDQPIVQDADGTATDEPIVQDADGTATDQPIVQDADGTATDQPIVLQNADGTATDDPIVLQDAHGTATDEPIVQDADGTTTDEPIVEQNEDSDSVTSDEESSVLHVAVEDSKESAVMEEAKEPSDSFVGPVEEAKEPSDSFVGPVEEAKEPSDSFVGPVEEAKEPSDSFVGPVEEAKEPSDSFVVAVEEAKEPSDSFVVAVEEAKKSSDSFVVAVEEAKKSSDSFVVAVEEAKKSSDSFVVAVEEAKKSSDSFVVAVEEAKEPSVNDAMEDSNESFSVTVVEDSLHNENRKFIEPSISEDFTSEKDVTLQNANNTTELKVEHAKKIDPAEDPVESRLSIAEVATDSTQTVVERQESVVRVKTTASASSSAASSDPHHHRIANCSTTNSEDFDNASCNLAIADFNEDDEFDKASVASSINNRQVLPSLLSPIRSPDSETVDQPAAPSGESASRLKRRSFPVDDFVRDLNTSSAFRAVASAIPDGWPLDPVIDWTFFLSHRIDMLESLPAEPLSYLDRINAGIAAIIDNRDDNNSADCCLDDDELDYLLQPGSIAELCRGGGVQPPWIVSRLIPFLERLLDKTADRNKDSRIGSLRRRCLACLMIVGPLSPQAAARSAVRWINADQPGPGDVIVGQVKRFLKMRPALLKTLFVTEKFPVCLLAA